MNRAIPITVLALTLTCLSRAPMVGADIVSAAADHMVLKVSAQSSLSVDALWARLIAPAAWWHPDHTYSADAANLSLELTAGGLWREDWEGGSVAHGSVLLVQPPSTLRLNAPFGPLQGMAVEAIWTISIAEDGDGSRATFDFVANGSSRSNLESLAPAVHGVYAAAVKRLVMSPEETP